MNEINVEKIMEEIRSQIPGERDGQAVPRFEDIPVNSETDVRWNSEAGSWALDKALAQASTGEQIAYFRSIPGGRIKGFAKRAVRKLIRFCVEPICQDISVFHTAVLSALDTLRHFVRETLTQNKRRDEEIRLLRAEVEELRRRLDQRELRP